MRTTHVVLPILIIALCSTISTGTVRPIDTVYKFGINMMDFKPSMRHDSLKQLFVDTLGMNCFHGQWNKYGSNSKDWADAEGGKVTGMIVLDHDGAIQRFSGFYSGEFMQYQAGVRPSTNDTLTHFYFIHGASDSTYGHPDSAHPTTLWTINGGSGYLHDNVVVLDSNEMPGHSYTYPYDWTWIDNADIPFRLAVKMHVTALDTTSDSSVISIAVIQHKHPDWSLDSVTPDDTIPPWEIKWKDFRSTNDTVLFLPTTFNFSSELRSTEWNGWLVSDVKLVVRSKRFVTTGIAWVTVMDVTADSLLSGFLLDSNSTSVDVNGHTLKDISKMCQTAIEADGYMLDTALSSNLFFAYLGDEPKLSDIQGHARVTQILKGMTPPVYAETEGSNLVERRYAASVRPQTFRSGNWFSSSWNSAIIDHGLSNPQTQAKPKPDSLDPLDTLQKYCVQGDGYFPYYRGNWIRPEVLDTMHSSAVFVKATPPSIRQTAANASISFDPFDYSTSQDHLKSNWRGLVQKSIESGFFSASVLNVDTLPYVPYEWWANIFTGGTLIMDTSVGNYPDAGHWVGGGGYYSKASPQIPEELNATSMCALAFGTRGLIYWIGVPYINGIEMSTGFTDRWGDHRSDWDTVGGIVVPVMNKRNCLWASKFSSFLRNNLQELFSKPWVGGFARNAKDSCTDTSSHFFDTLACYENFVKRPSATFIVDYAADTMYRYMLDTVRASDTTTDSVEAHKVLEQLPRNLAWVVYGMFTDTASSNRYVVVLNTAADPRSLTCKWIDSAEADINATYTKRGRRILYTHMKSLDSSTLYYVRELSTPAWDTTMRGNFCLVSNLDAGEGKVYCIQDNCEITYSGITPFANSVTVPHGCVYTATGQSSSSAPTALLATDTSKSIDVYGELDVNSKNGGTVYNTSSHHGGDVIRLNINVKNGGKVVVKNGADARFEGNVTVEQGGSFIVEPNAIVRLRHHTYTCAGTFEFKGVSSGSAQQSYLRQDTSAGAPNLRILDHGTLKMDSLSWPTLDASIQVETGGQWNFAPRSSTIFKRGRKFYDFGTFQVQGDSGYTALLKCDTSFVRVQIGSRAGTSARAFISYADVRDVGFVAQQAAGYVRHSSFHALEDERDTDYACIAIYNLVDTLDVSNNEFYASRRDTAIAIRDNLNNFTLNPSASYRYEPIGQNVIHKFRIGIDVKQGTAAIVSNTLDSCQDAIQVQYVSGRSEVSLNTVSRSYANGIICIQSSPYVLGNTVTSCWTSGFQGVASNSFLGCNEIAFNGDWGIITDATALINMGVDPNTLHSARNFVHDNGLMQIRSFDGTTVTLDSGENNINVDGLSLAVQLCAPPVKALLGVGHTPPLGTNILARRNYWGTYYNAAPLTDFCLFGASADATDTLPSKPTACGLGDVSAFDDSMDCTYFTTYFDGQSGYFSDACDSLLARYNKEIACGNCSAALLDLDSALVRCDPAYKPDLTALLQRVLRSSLDCNGRDVIFLASVAEFFGSYAARTAYDSNRIPAKWMQANAYGAGQYFSTAIALLDSIAGLHWVAPFDSASAMQMAADYQDMLDVEGDTPLPFGKRALRSAGRLGTVPEEVNPLALEVAPNPFTTGTTVYYEIPVEDADEVTEVVVYNMLVQVVNRPVHDFQSVGKHTVRFDAGSLPAGRYIVAVHTRNHQQSKLIILTR